MKPRPLRYTRPETVTAALAALAAIDADARVLAGGQSLVPLCPCGWPRPTFWWHRQIKACVGGVAAAVTGDPAVFVSVPAAHQGPDGGGPVAAIVDLGENR